MAEYCHGPLIAADGVHFRLWAPDAAAVSLELEGRVPRAMHARANGWKEIVVDCDPGARYRFRVGDIAVPDPASRMQRDGVHGWSVLRVPNPVAPDAWCGRPWREIVIYEVHAGLAGGYRGLAARLPELKAMGVTAVELMPIAAFPGDRGWGYDGVLPFAPVKAYGTPDDLRSLIAQAHNLGLMMYLDVVYNHFGPDGNYLHLYAKRFFRTDIHTPWGAAIDFRQQPVRRFCTENALYWIEEFGFDGLRLDAVHAIRDDGWLGELCGEIRKRTPGRHIHLMLENEDNAAYYLRHGFDAQWNDDIHHVLHVLLTGERKGYYADFAHAPARGLARALEQGFIYQGQVSEYRRRARGECSADLPPTAFIAFLQNHDQVGNRAFGERLTVLADPRALKAAVALLLLSPQIPMLFMGEEIGSRAPFLYFTDHNASLARAVRDGRRKEFAAFLGEETAELPDPNALETFANSDPWRDAPDAAEWQAHYRALLALRHTHVVPYLDGAHALQSNVVGAKAVTARWRLGNGAVLTIASNLDTTPVTTELPASEPIWGQSAAGRVPAATTLAWLEAP